MSITTTEERKYRADTAAQLAELTAWKYTAEQRLAALEAAPQPAEQPARDWQVGDRFRQVSGKHITAATGEGYGGNFTDIRRVTAVEGDAIFGDEGETYHAADLLYIGAEQPAVVGEGTYWRGKHTRDLNYRVKDGQVEYLNSVDGWIPTIAGVTPADLLDDDMYEPCAPPAAAEPVQAAFVEDVQAKLVAYLATLPERRESFHKTYNGGHHDEPAHGAFHHGMDTVFNALKSEIPALLAKLGVQQ